MVQVNIATLTEEQLTAFAFIAPEAAREERTRRFAYGTQRQFLTELAQAALDLEAALAGHRQTAAARAVKDSGVLLVVQRGLAHARATGLEFTEPELRINGTE